MRIIVTGSDGYIGKGVVELLLAHGHDVCAFGLRPCGISHKCLHETIGDVFEFDFTQNMAVVPDAMLHLAWRNGFNHNDIAHLVDLPKHYQLFKNALDAGIRHIAAMGSMHEVGYHEGEVDADTACNPTTPYGVAKNALRQLGMELCRQRDARMQWLRGFYLVSCDGRGDSVFTKIVNAAASGQESFPFTSGNNGYDFLPYEEFCSQIVAVVEQQKFNGIINICSGECVTLKEYVEKFIRDNALPIRLDYGKYPDRPYDSPAIWGDASIINQIMEEAQ